MGDWFDPQSDPSGDANGFAAEERRRCVAGEFESDPEFRDRMITVSRSTAGSATLGPVTPVRPDFRRIDTIAGLDVLPDGALVRGAVESFALALKGKVFERSGVFSDGRSKWMVMGRDLPDHVTAIKLPALLLWHPSGSE